MARTQVQSELIATNAISGTIIADNAITATHIATNSISGTLVQDSGIVTTMIANNNVTATKIVTDAIQTRHIADDQVTGDKLTNNITIAGTLTSTGAFTSPGIDDNADATAITINSSERVMIGTTTEGRANEGADMFTIGDDGSNNSGMTMRSGTTGYGSIYFSDATSGTGEYAGYIQYNHNTDQMLIATNSETKLAIHSSGCVGIGSTVDRSIDTNVGTLVINDSAGGGLWLSDDDQSSTTSKIYSFTEGSVGKLRINQGSGVGGGGIDFTFNENYTAPNMRLTTVDTLFGKTSNDLDTAGAHIISAGTYAGSVYSGITSAVASSTYHVRDTTNNTWEFYVTNAGVINATSTSISSLSDERLKENIKDLETGLDEVMALKPRRFDWRDREEKNVAGFIAQEVEPVLPDLIGDFMHDDLDDAKTVKMSDMIPTLVKAIQEQQEIIEELKANSHPCKELHEFDAYPDLIKRIEELENK